MKTTVARSKSPASSPIESSSSTPGSVRLENPDCDRIAYETPACASFSATTENRSGRRGAIINNSPG